MGFNSDSKLTGSNSGSGGSGANIYMPVYGSGIILGSGSTAGDGVSGSGIISGSGSTAGDGVSASGLADTVSGSSSYSGAPVSGSEQATGSGTDNGSPESVHTPGSGSGIGSGKGSVPTIIMPSSTPEFEITDNRNESFTGFRVEILVRNEVSAGIIPPSPPLYRLGSSMTLFCRVFHASGPLSYSWSTTARSRFTSYSTSVFNRKAVLTAADAGVYTCSVSDSDGNTQQDSVEMKFNGAEVYVVHSRYNSGHIVANNSMVIHDIATCPRECSTDIIVYSNSSQTNAEVIFPYSRTYTSSSTVISGYRIMEMDSAIRVVLPNTISEDPPLNQGIFTFRVADSNGYIINLNIGIYMNSPDSLRLSTTSSGFTDLTADSRTTAMAQLECYTTDSPPASVTWLRNGENIIIDGSAYASTQIVANRHFSHYRNILYMRDIVSLIGELIFSCTINNSLDSVTHEIPTTLSVLPTAHIFSRLESGFEGGPVILDCEGSVNLIKAAAQLVVGDHISVNWFGPDGNLLIGEKRNSNIGVTNTLTIPETSFMDSGLYTCEVTLDLPNTNQSHTVTAQYRLVLLKNLTVTLPDSEVMPTSDIRCTWSGGQIERMEWLFLGENVIVPMEHTNSNWNNAKFMCIVHSGEVLTLTVKASFTNDLSIEASTERPTAGENITLTCTVVSDRPPIMRWVGDGTGSESVVVHSQVNSGFNSTLVIEFSPLHTSHGGVYTCVSSICQSPSAHDSQLEYSLQVQIPDPNVTITTEPRQDNLFHLDSRVVLVCTVEYSVEVDTAVDFTAIWSSGFNLQPLESNDRVTLTEQRHSHAINSTVTVDALRWSDSNIYICTGQVVPSIETAAAVIGSTLTQYQRIAVALNVRIEVDYNPPPDFSLRPPYYRPASSVILRCITEDVATPLQYSWSTLCPDCVESNYTYQSSSQVRSITILSLRDAGTHKCTVTDSEGRSGYATTEIKLFGAGIYIERDIVESQASTAVPNNTALYFIHELTATCFSNMTTASAAIVFPDDTAHTSGTTQRLTITTLDYTGIRLYFRALNYAPDPPTGVYTCRFSDFDGSLVDTSITLTFYFRRELELSSDSYTDFSKLSNAPLTPGSVVAQFCCTSIYAAPTNVTWVKNGQRVNAEHGYNAGVMVSRRDYLMEFVNTLSIYNVTGVVGNNTYTCILENQYDHVSETFNLDNTEHTASTIIPSSQVTYHGNKLVLTCKARHPPINYHGRTVILLEWSGPTAEDNADISIRRQYAMNDVVHREIVFNYLTSHQNGTNECRVSIHFELFDETVVYNNDYTLSVQSALTTNAYYRNEFIYVPGISENILCAWNGRPVQTLEWFLEDFDYQPIVSETNTTSLNLTPDRTTQGIDRTRFTCRATAHSGHQFEETVSLHRKGVRVLIDSDIPSDFLLPSPPYYPPASSVSFTCSSHGLPGPIQYQWTSTGNSFPRQSAKIDITNMNIHDAGNYTCTVTDGHGITSHITTTIIFTGVGIFVDNSEHIRNQAVVNNTALERYGYRQLISFYCSASTSDSSLSIIVPDGSIYSDSYTYGISQVPPAGIRLFEYRPRIGIYTCKVNDSTGLNTVEVNIGLYTYVGPPLFVRGEFRDLSGSTVPAGSAVASYTCFTRNFPPTTVAWSRNGEPIAIDDVLYSTTQIMTNRVSSSYQSVLFVHKITEVLGNPSPTYACSITNAGGQVSGNIQGGITVSAVTAIRSPFAQVYQGQFVLDCEVTIEAQYMERIAPYTVDIVWSGPENVIAKLRCDPSVIEETHHYGNNHNSSLTFLSLNTSHNGDYSCQTVFRLPDRNSTIGQSSVISIRQEAIIITGHEDIHLRGSVVELMCEGKDKDISRMEWISQSTDTVLASASHTNYLSLLVNTSRITRLHEVFTCIVRISNGIQLLKSVPFRIRELVHSVALTEAPSRPAVGTNFTLVCTVTREQPSLITWIGHNGLLITEKDGLTITEESSGDSTVRSYLTFHPLRASHGVEYACNSVMNITAVGQNQSQSHLLNVQIPEPQVIVSRMREGVIDIGSNQLLNCSVAFVEVDVHVTVTLQWSLHASLLREYNISGNLQEYYAIFELDSYGVSDSGAYICAAFVKATNTSAAAYAENSITLTSTNAYNVGIEVDYNPPSDFSLPSPPYYRPASSVTLTCVAHDAIDTVQYQWTSTQNRSFAHTKNDSSISHQLLTAHDAGIHTCTVTDHWGNTGTASTEMSLFGMGIYVEQSQNIVNSTVANNSHLVFQGRYVCYQCVVTSFSCFSNMTDVDVRVRYQTHRYNDPWHKVKLAVRSGLRMTVFQNNYYIVDGTYSCEVENSTFVETTQVMAIGIYRLGSEAIISHHYTEDFTDDASTMTLAVVTCETRNIQPQHVFWLRNGEFLSEDNYEIIQHLIRRRGSVYNNSLAIRDAIGLLNSPVYTCTISNGNMTLSRDIFINIDLSVEIEAGIVAPSTEAAVGENVSITCQIHTIQSKPTLTNPLLQRYLRIEWFDRDNNPVIAQGSLTFSNISSKFSHSLHFNPLSKGQDRMYVCVARLDFPGFQSTSTTKYPIIVDSAFLQLKFDVIPCTFLSEYQTFASDLETTIKQTLADVVNVKCKCNFQTESIVEGEFSCIKSRSISYRARIDGSSDTQSTELMLDTLQSWKRSYGTFLFSSSINLRLWVDPFCPLEIKSLQEPLCHV